MRLTHRADALRIIVSAVMSNRTDVEQAALCASDEARRRARRAALALEALARARAPIPDRLRASDRLTHAYRVMVRCALD